MKVYAARAGEPAGCIHTDKDKNYTSCTVPHQRKNWFAARVVWILHNGYLHNDYVIDHIDGNTLNNSISNLRAVKQAINNRNASKRKDNHTGFSGTHFTVASDKKSGFYTYVTASWYGEDGKRSSKHFAVAKYGLLPAFKMACEYRDEKINMLKVSGLEYSEKHGK